MPGMAAFFFKGLVPGLSIAAPVGPIGMLCIRRSLASGRAAGLATGLGAATADACYGAIAALGLTGITAVLVSQRYWLTLLGGVFLCWLGARTLTNPMTIVSFAAAFAGLGLALARDYRAATALVTGVFIGSALWWLFLSTVTARIRHRFDARWLRRVNLVSGAILIAFGVYALASAL